MRESRAARPPRRKSPCAHRRCPRPAAPQSRCCRARRGANAAVPIEDGEVGQASRRALRATASPSASAVPEGASRFDPMMRLADFHVVVRTQGCGRLREQMRHHGDADAGVRRDQHRHDARGRFERRARCGRRSRWCRPAAAPAAAAQARACAATHCGRLKSTATAAPVERGLRIRGDGHASRRRPRWPRPGPAARWSARPGAAQAQARGSRASSRKARTRDWPMRPLIPKTATPGTGAP